MKKWPFVESRLLKNPVWSHREFEKIGFVESGTGKSIRPDRLGWGSAADVLGIGWAGLSSGWERSPARRAAVLGIGWGSAADVLALAQLGWRAAVLLCWGSAADVLGCRRAGVLGSAGLRCRRAVLGIGCRRAGVLLSSGWERSPAHRTGWAGVLLWSGWAGAGLALGIGWR